MPLKHYISEPIASELFMNLSYPETVNCSDNRIDQFVLFMKRKELKY